MSAKDIDTQFISGLIFEEDQGWSSLCLEYDIASHGDTPIEAVQNNLEAVAAYLETCFMEGKGLEDARRPAPLKYFILFVWYAAADAVRRRIQRPRQFKEPLPFKLLPQH